MLRTTRLIKVLLVGILVAAACANGGSTGDMTTTSVPGWTVEDYKDVVDFCASLDLDPTHCPRVTRELRDFGCGVEAAFEMMARAVEANERPTREAREKAWGEAAAELCPPDFAGQFPWLEPDIAEDLSNG